jgi:hypothetical protein
MWSGREMRILSPFSGEESLRVPFILVPLKKMVLDQVTTVEGLMRLLMKERNGVPWTPEDKAQLRGHLRTLSGSVPALAVFSLPGGALLLPARAWLVDRRKKKRPGAPGAPAVTAAASAPGQPLQT